MNAAYVIIVVFLTEPEGALPLVNLLPLSQTEIVIYRLFLRALLFLHVIFCIPKLQNVYSRISRKNTRKLSKIEEILFRGLNLNMNDNKRAKLE